MTAHFPEPEAFLEAEINLDTAAIPSMQTLSDAERQRMIRDISAEMAEPLHEVTNGNQVVLPFHAFLVHGSK
jgi:hypothetical protein